MKMNNIQRTKNARPANGFFLLIRISGQSHVSLGRMRYGEGFVNPTLVSLFIPFHSLIELIRSSLAGICLALCSCRKYCSHFPHVGKERIHTHEFYERMDVYVRSLILINIDNDVILKRPTQDQQVMTVEEVSTGELYLSEMRTFLSPGRDLCIKYTLDTEKNNTSSGEILVHIHRLIATSQIANPNKISWGHS